MEIGYWNTKGLAEPCRWTLAYLGIESTEYNPADKEEWAAKKPSMGAFPNLPYIKDGDFVLSETAAMWTYIAHKANKPEFLGKDGQEAARVRQVEGVINDIKMNLTKVMYSEDKAAAAKEAFAEGSAVHKKLEEINNYLEGRQFIVSDVTIADLLTAYFVEFICSVGVTMTGECPLKQYPNLLAHGNRVRNLAGIKQVVEKRKDMPYSTGLKPFSELDCLKCCQ
jgi:glutathione S-transferase